MVCIDPRKSNLPHHLHSACRVANDLIAHKARALARQYRWTDRDADDIASDLWLATLNSWDRNPDHPNPEALTTVVVQRASISMLRRRCALRRDPARQLADFEPEEHPAAPTDPDADLRLDVEALSRRLTPAAQSLIEGLREDTMAGVSRRTGIPRSTLYGHLGEIRKKFQPLADTVIPPILRTIRSRGFWGSWSRVDPSC